METFIGFILAILSGVIVARISLRFAAQQRVIEETEDEAKKNDAILNSIAFELQWNRQATRGNVDVTNVHVAIGALTTVAFERFGAELANIAPDSIKDIFEHYALVGRVREGIRNIAAVSNREADERLRNEWIQLSRMAGAELSNSASKALTSLNMPLELAD